MNNTPASPYPPLWRFSPENHTALRRDLALGAFASILIHAGVVWIGSTRPQVAAPVALLQSPLVAPVAMPPLDIEKAEPVLEERTDHTQEILDPLPVQPEPPQIPRPDDIIVPFEPTPPQPVHTNHIRINPNSRPYLPPIKVYTVALLDKPPMPLAQGRPIYPHELKAAGIGGQAVVDFIVDEKGFVSNASIVSASDNSFGLNAASAVAKWRFKPGMKAGKAVPTRMQVPIVFNVDEKS